MIGVRLTLIAAVAAQTSLFGVAMARADCAFAEWFTFKGTTLHLSADGKAYVYTTSHSRIDADGAPNAYHPGDVGKNCSGDPHIGLDCPANAGFPGTSWWPSVLVPDPNNPSKPFVQPSGPFKGFFISGTWLSDHSKPTTDPARYVDSSNIPYLVFPGSQFAQRSGTGFKGDVGIAWHTGNNKVTPFIVADQGGGSDALLGEGSIALYQALGGQNVNPRTGTGVAPGEVRFIIFPGSRRAVQKPWPRTMDSIRDQANALLAEIGGEQAVKDCN